ncbi:sugar phosphate isomerase/epimerase family protein [Zavarzinella formosa]|uniref:sugar phosphate isomerase/epimerase family protein n=1 Tax=Zavarzinella formosa TaxID=360055 RepID=UPI00031EA005|nr:sugar phosphate isomerase/epimerase family protein [Zavarzinella formosa]
MPVKISVTVSLVPEAKGGPFVFWDGLEDGMKQAAELGYDAVEIFPPGPEAIPADVVRSLMTKHGLAVAAVGTGGGWVKHKLTLTHADETIRAKAREFISKMIAAAGALGAPAIIGSMQGRWGESVSKEMAFVWLADALNDLGEQAKKLGVPLLYEPLNRYETNLFCTVADGVSFLNTLQTTNVKLLADLYHMNIEEVNLADALVAGETHIGHIHFADSNRRPAGLGHTDFRPIADAVVRAGYDGYFSAEVFAYPNSRQAAEQTRAKFRELFGR